MKKILAFSSYLLLILALFSMKSDITASASSTDVQDVEIYEIEETEENWHVGGINIDCIQASVEQDEQTMNDVTTTQTVTEETTEAVDGTADSAIPTNEAATTEAESQQEEEIKEVIIPSVPAPEIEEEEYIEEVAIEEDETPNAGVVEQGSVKEAVVIKGAEVIEDEKEESKVDNDQSTEVLEDENQVPSKAVTLEDEDVPSSSAILPQTGVASEKLYYAIGFVICALGVSLFRLMNKKKMM